MSTHAGPEASTERVDAVVVGAGVVGLAVARALAMAGREVLILEAADRCGSATSSRSSEVLHAGLYAAPHTWRARAGVDGRLRLARYLERRALPWRRCGKLVIAADAAEGAALDAIAANASACGVDDLERWSAAAVRERAPALRCTAALWSPSTGILDSHALMTSLLGDAQAHGALLALRSPVESIVAWADGSLQLAVGGVQPMHLAARLVVNAAGHGAVPLARATRGLSPAHVPGQWFAKGCYFALSGAAPVDTLVYPAPGASGHLGVHLTLDLAGRARFGPSFRWVADDRDTAVDEDPASFEAAVRRYWPGLPDGALQPDYAGIRPKISGPGEPLADFRIDGPARHGIAGLVNLFGIESPGLTSCLALARAALQAAGIAPPADPDSDPGDGA